MFHVIQAVAGAPWYTNPSHYVALCIVLFFALLIWKGAHKAMGTALDDRATKIQAELEEVKEKTDAIAIPDEPVCAMLIACKLPLYLRKQKGTVAVVICVQML